MRHCRRCLIIALGAFALTCGLLHAAPIVSALPNGLHVVVSDEPGSDRIAVVLMIRAGDSDDPPDSSGAARVLGHILLEPANHRAPGRFGALAVSGQTRVDTEADVTTFTVTTTPDDAGTAVRLLAALVEAPVWNNTTLIRSVKRNGEDERDDVPSDWQHDYETWMSRVGLAPPPLSPAVPPRETLRKLFEDRYQAKNMALSIVGDLRGLDATGEAAARFGALPRTADTVVRRRRFPSETVRDSSGAYAFAGYPAPAATDPLAPAVEVIAATMGVGKTSEIFRTLRDVEGTGYESGAVYARGFGPTGVALFSRAPGKAPKVRDDLVAIWRKAALDTRTDWGSARSRAVVAYALKHQTVRDRAYWLAFWELSGKGAAYDIAYPEAMLRVSNSDLQAAAKRWMSAAPVSIP